MMITDEEIAYDLSVIPAVAEAIAAVSDEDMEDGASDLWTDLLIEATEAMDDDLRIEIFNEIDMDETDQATVLAVYCARHEARYGRRFDF